MRKHDVRKWLHAILDLLPVILIPVFMIYSHRHTIDSGSIQVSQNEVVDFNQLQVEDVSPSIVYDVSYEINDYLLSIVGTPSNDGVPFNLQSLHLAIKDHIYLYKGGYYNEDLNVANNYSINRSYLNNDVIFTASETYTSYWFVSQNLYNVPIDFQIYFNYFDLTQMFGVGNEPTIEQFNQWYDESYYEYTLSHKELLKGVSTITYDDTDIMSQATYQLYNAVDKYFNMGNVFNLGGVYDWFNLNIFNGNSPIAIYIVWNIVLYEFVMDLLFLLYGLFMWFIDMVEKLMEKPINSVR